MSSQNHAAQGTTAATAFDLHSSDNESVEDGSAFFSQSYPLSKSKGYAEMRKPFILNNLDTQEMLQDRRRVYSLL